MSDDEEDLRLNTLNRFRKRSPKLLLEQYSHCEVPAGCGGVVLRWVDPASTIPAIVRVYCPGESKIFVDGNELGSSRVDLAAGAHVLALELSIPEPAGGPLLATVLFGVLSLLLGL